MDARLLSSQCCNSHPYFSSLWGEQKIVVPKLHLGFPFQLSAPPPGGPVSLVSVGDGDTIRVTTAKGQKMTVRLACIDAPETACYPDAQAAPIQRLH